MAAKPKINIVKFPEPPPPSDMEQIIEQLRMVNAEDILVIYKTDTGVFDALTNQGDLAGMLLFMEEFKYRALQRVIDEREKSGA